MPACAREGTHSSTCLGMSKVMSPHGTGWVGIPEDLREFPGTRSTVGQGWRSKANRLFCKPVARRDTPSLQPNGQKSKLRPFVL